MNTIAGGVVIDPNAKKVNKVKDNYIDELKIKESGKTTNILESTVKNLSPNYPDKNEILKGLGQNLENIEEKLMNLVEEEKVIALQGLSLIHI